MMKDLEALLKANPNIFNSHEYRQEAMRKPLKITFIFAQPRSGSTLLLRLLNMACLTETIGDRPTAFYEGIITAYQALKDPKFGQFGSILVAEEKGEFWDEFRSSSRMREEYLMRDMVALMLGQHNWKSSYSKTTSLGFGNDLVEPCADMLRDMYDVEGAYANSFDLTIAFLVRDHDEIVTSFQTKEGPGQKAVIDNPSVCHDMLSKQRDQFKAVRDLSDPWITYNKLCEDPMGVLKKLNPLYQPNQRVIDSIMSKKLR